MIIKVCGMKDPGNISQVAELKPDYMGFIFYPHSKRFIGSPDAELITSVPEGIKRTGVFVDEPMDGIADKVIQYQLDAVQLHGKETAEFCRSMRKFLQNMQTEKHVEIIKAFGISTGFDFSTLAAYEDFVDYFLFDTKTSDHGGSGLTFDWEILDHYHGGKHYLLSGGLSPANMIKVKELHDARMAGVDLNSRFEIEPGLKDPEKLVTAFKLLRD